MKASTILLALTAAMPAFAAPAAEPEANALEARTNQPTCGQAYSYCQSHHKRAWCKSGNGYKDCTDSLPGYGKQPYSAACPSGKTYFCPDGISANVAGLIFLCIDLEVLIPGLLGIST